jgi:hypothetical protein
MVTPEPGPAREMNELEATLARLRPVAGALSRDRMLFEAGRASARFEARHRFLIATSASLLIALIGTGGLLLRERTRRHGLEMELGARNYELTAPPADAVQPELLPRSEISPSSYLALSRHIQPAGLDELIPVVEGDGPGQPATDSAPIVPIRIRDTQRALDL